MPPPPADLSDHWMPMGYQSRKTIAQWVHKKRTYKKNELRTAGVERRIVHTLQQTDGR